jgi:hypothetical protein
MSSSETLSETIQVKQESFILNKLNDISSPEWPALFEHPQK